MSHSVHPVIRIVTFLVAAVVLAGSAPRAMALIAVGLAGVYAALVPQAWRAPLTVFRRLRWLLLSLLIVYGWFTPGAALFPALGAAGPTYEGLSEGLLRAGALLLIAAAAQLLLMTTDRPSLLAAVYWLAWPLSGLGISRDRLALRLMLTLDAVPHLSAVLGPSLYEGLSGHAAARLGQVAARAFQGAIDQAERQPSAAVEFGTVIRPPWYQWVYPVALGAVLMQ